jgi:hypothetical protein
MDVSFGHDNDASVSVKDGEFIEQLSVCRLLNTESVACS